MNPKLSTALVLATTLAAAAALADAGPSDAQIAAIVVTANQVDIDVGKLAQTRARAPEVKEFANLMVTDHTSVNEAATALVTELKVTPQESAASDSLKQDGEAQRARLQELEGSAFDRAYVDNEVAYHQTVLDALDETLIPSADNDRLKALLVKVRPAFVAHLEHARQLQSKLGKGRE